MAKIFVAGALDLTRDDAQQFVAALGAEVIARGHTLLDGCRNEFDRQVAKSAAEAAEASKVDPMVRVISYAAVDAQPVHSFGTVLRSRLATWGLESSRLYIPEPIYDADSVIIVGGKEGTQCAANWARIAKKPLLPITAFGGAGQDVFEEEIRDFREKYADRIERLQYDALNQVLSDPVKLATEVVALAARMQASSSVFTVMSFSPDPKLIDAFDTFKETCTEFSFDCSKVDDAADVERIVPAIFDRIRKAAFVIADLTDQRPNVLYELGYAQGLGKPCIITAYKGTTLPFDVHDIPTIFWESQKQLKEQLRERIKAIAFAHGH
jgi:nucleoside 2-deoxyribosyltransferase